MITSCTMQLVKIKKKLFASNGQAKLIVTLTLLEN